MSNKFTEKAENALNSAVRLAESLGHTYIGTEHILLSLFLCNPASDVYGCCLGCDLSYRRMVVEGTV